MTLSGTMWQWSDPWPEGTSCSCPFPSLISRARRGGPRWSLLRFQDGGGRDDLLTRSLFQQEAVKRGVLLLVTHNMTAAHEAAAIEETLEDAITERPLAAIGLAVGLGFLIGVTWRR